MLILLDAQIAHNRLTNDHLITTGINHGPITAGVIGVKKPHFDMWGNTVNVASRMESTGRAGAIQVVEETATILQHFGFQFDQRGLITVKGKGKLMTYYLTGRQPRAAVNSSAQSSQKAIKSMNPSGSGGGGGGNSGSTALLVSAGGPETASGSSKDIAPTIPLESNGTIKHNMSASSSINNGLNLTNSRNLLNQQSNCLQESQTSLQHVSASPPTQPQSSGTTNDTSNKRMYITPPRQDISTDADIHLV